jgi:transposase
VALVDALGNLARFIVLPGQRHDSVGVEPLLDGISLEALIGDKAFDSDWLRAELNERGALAVIPPNGSRAGTIPYQPVDEVGFRQFERVATMIAACTA